jgi:hypothetical protein
VRWLDRTIIMPCRCPQQPPTGSRASIKEHRVDHRGYVLGHPIAELSLARRETFARQLARSELRSNASNEAGDHCTIELARAPPLRSRFGCLSSGCDGQEAHTGRQSWVKQRARMTPIAAAKQIKGTTLSAGLQRTCVFRQ